MTSISSKKKPVARKVKLSDGTVIQTDDNRKNDFKRGKVGKHEEPKRKFSTESLKFDHEWKIEDDYDQLPYPPPRRNPLFRKFWAESIENITPRSNFQEAHLAIFETYCGIRADIRALDNFIAANGHTYEFTTVAGKQRKTYPEVMERNKAWTQLAHYSRMLDLLPKKDRARSVKKEDEDGWGD